ncbi:hypothetical protein BP00DRAFT_413492 [Aspergillus indologenus CBS 114.80]|uniref:Uncharacterized protein n=1 Tax=Aspergillus indologenus CBS 114.80 TaxID=1450541 RepID=A0A2V5IY20_9EURO|nr:hypothetical protein BP00DRAFT_413492 [Aspergillus indologenus CBS 114.80]
MSTCGVENDSKITSTRLYGIEIDCTENQKTNTEPSSLKLLPALKPEPYLDFSQRNLLNCEYWGELVGSTGRPLRAGGIGMHPRVGLGCSPATILANLFKDIPIVAGIASGLLDLHPCISELHVQQSQVCAQLLILVLVVGMLTLQPLTSVLQVRLLLNVKDKA